MPDAPPFGNDVLPALQTLLRHFRPHINVIIIVFLVLGPHNAIEGWDKILPSHPSTQFLLLVLAVYQGYLKIPGLEIPGATLFPAAPTTTTDTAADPDTAPIATAPPSATGALPAAASLVEPLLALHSIYKNLESYLKAGFLLWLTYYVCHQAPLFSQQWPFYLLPFGIAVLGYFSPTTRFYGPIRFGYLEYGQHFAQAYKILLDWWIIALVIFLPFPRLVFFFGAVISAFSLAAWVRVSFSYHKELRSISSQVAKDTSRAKAAAAAAHDEASSFHRYEDHVIKAAASARRDAVQSSAVRFTDFFDCAARAWSAMGQVTQPAETAVARADELIEAATDVTEADKPGDDDKSDDEDEGETRNDLLARYLDEAAKEARSKANDVVSQLKVAQEAVTRSNAAAAQDSRARAAAEANAVAVLTVTQRISGRAASLLSEEAQAARMADEVSTLASQALSAARGGEMARARQIASAATTAADSADSALGHVRAARATALEDLIRWLQSSRGSNS